MSRRQLSTWGLYVLLATVPGLGCLLGRTSGAAATQTEAELAARVLATAAETPPLACRVMEHTVAARLGPSVPWDPPSPAADPQQGELLRWLTGSRPDEAAVRVLLADGLGSADPCVRGVAARLLARSRGEAARSGLLQALRSGSESTRAAAATALGFARSPAALDELAQALSRDPSVAVRANAAWALGMLADPRAAEPLRRVLDDRQASIRAAAARSLGETRSRAGGLLDRLASLLRGDPDPAVRAAAATALGRIRSPDATGALAAALNDSVTRVRWLAAWALGEIRDPAAAGALAGALRRDPGAQVRETAAWALGTMEARSGIEVLERALGDGDASVRTASAWALGNVPDERSVPVLAGALADASPEVREAAAWALGQVAPRTAPQPLVAALGDREEKVREKAAWALGRTGDRRTVPALTAALRRGEGARFRRAVLWAVARLEGEVPPNARELLGADDSALRDIVEFSRGGSAFRGMPMPWPWPRPFPE